MPMHITPRHVRIPIGDSREVFVRSESILRTFRGMINPHGRTEKGVNLGTNSILYGMGLQFLQLEGTLFQGMYQPASHRLLKLEKHSHCTNAQGRRATIVDFAYLRDHQVNLAVHFCSPSQCRILVHDPAHRPRSG
jgi:hypothetical protein